MSRDSIRSRLNELEKELPSEAKQWIVSLLDTLPERNSDSRVFVVEDMRDGQPVYKNPERVARQGDGVIETTDGVNIPKPPEEFTHVASGPKCVSSPVVHRWKIYVDLNRHTPPESVNVEELPVGIMC